MIDPIHKPYNALVLYPTMHHSEQKCTFLFWMVHCEIWDRCTVISLRLVHSWALKLLPTFPGVMWTVLTHWGWVTHICVSKLTIIGSSQAIICTNAKILWIRHLGTNFNEKLIEILTFLFIKMRLKVSSAKWRPLCLGLNVLTTPPYNIRQLNINRHIKHR